jgi:hypothetical protein
MCLLSIPGGNHGTGHFYIAKNRTFLLCVDTSDTKSAPPTQKQPPSQAAVAPSPQDTVQISTAAQTALQESQETRTQTAQEAAHGDHQAVKLLAKETPSK